MEHLVTLFCVGCIAAIFIMLLVIFLHEPVMMLVGWLKSWRTEPKDTFIGTCYILMWTASAIACLIGLGEFVLLIFPDLL